jgi:peptidoglycan/xylan/chitin deacetylase (PgdA/CDA1 family)
MSATPRVAILAHHKIGPVPPAPGGWPSWYYVSSEAFIAQLLWLKEHGYAYLGMDAFLDGLERPETLPPKSALITFDDGYRSIFRHGLPELQAAGCPAVIFVPTDFAGKKNSWDDGREPEEALCSWDEFRALEKAGIAIQPHSVSHRALSRLSDGEIEAEIVGSKRAIETHLNRPATFFSFPFGDNSERPGTVDALLEKHGYRAACLYKGGEMTLPAANRFRLTRIALGADSDIASIL